jgi:hypothetical protein
LMDTFPCWFLIPNVKIVAYLFLYSSGNGP